MKASDKGKTDTVALLLDKGANMEAKDKDVYLNTQQCFSLCLPDHVYPL
jgi:hypothetical protein